MQTSTLPLMEPPWVELSAIRTSPSMQAAEKRKILFTYTMEPFLKDIPESIILVGHFVFSQNAFLMKIYP